MWARSSSKTPKWYYDNEKTNLLIRLLRLHEPTPSCVLVRVLGRFQGPCWTRMESPLKEETTPQSSLFGLIAALQGHLAFYEPRLFYKAELNLLTTYPSLEKPSLYLRCNREDRSRMENRAKMTIKYRPRMRRLRPPVAQRAHRKRTPFLFLCCGDVNKQTRPLGFMEPHSLLKRLQPLCPGILPSLVLLTCLWASYL